MEALDAVEKYNRNTSLLEEKKEELDKASKEITEGKQELEAEKKKLEKAKKQLQTGKENQPETAVPFHETFPVQYTGKAFF